MSESANDIEQAKATFGKHLVESHKVPLENLDHLWRPFLMLSRAIGVFPYATMDRDRQVRWWRNWWNLFSAIYVGAAIYMFSLLVHYILVEGVPKIVIGADYLSYAAFYLHIILSTGTFIYFLNSKPYLIDLCKLWSCLLFTQNTAARLNADIKRKVRRNLALTVAGCALYLFATIVIHVSHGFYEDYSGVLMVLFFIWCLAANVVQLGLFCTVCRTSSYLLKSISLDLEAKLAEDSVDVHLRWFRDVFMTVVDFVEVSNQLLGRYAGFLVTFFLIETCCNTYLFFPYGHIDNALRMICDLIFAVEGLVIIFIVCLSAGEISDQSGRPFRILLKTNVTESPSNSQIQELMLMLDCSRTLQANICMFGIMPITKESLPMIFGIYLSYVFLLYQFPQDSDKACALQLASNATISN